MPKNWSRWGFGLLLSVGVVVGLAQFGLNLGAPLGAFVQGAVHWFGTPMLP